MKKTLLIILLLIPFFGFSQTTKPIEAFLGIKFGSSKAEVIAAMKAKGYKLANSNANSETNLEFGIINYGHRETTAFGVKFIDDKAYEAVFIFKADEDPKTIDYYNNLVSDVNDVYGPGKPTKVFRYPYADGDGDELTAIEGGYADFSTHWTSDNKNFVEARITSEMDVILFYDDKALADQAIAKQKDKEKSDM